MDNSIKKHIFFVIPSFNEAKALPQVISKVHKVGYSNLIIIDDGSSDNTADVIPSNVTYLRHVVNRGQGAALRTGMEYALQQSECKYIVHFDSDGQHRIEDLPLFIKELETSKYDIVLGSRFLKKSSRKLVPIKKRILLRGAIIFEWILTGVKLTDAHNGYRAMTKDAARKIDISMDQFEHATEIIEIIGTNKLRFTEVPVHIDYTDYAMQKGQRISNSIRIALRMIFK
jgi:glycosyltransferase involved in cell wall biosynthesis